MSLGQASAGPLRAEVCCRQSCVAAYDQVAGGHSSGRGELPQWPVAAWYSASSAAGTRPRSLMS